MLCIAFIIQYYGPMSKKRIIQVLFLTMAKALALEKWILKYMSYWSSQNMGAKIRNWEEFKSFSLDTLYQHFSCSYCYIISTTKSKFREPPILIHWSPAFSLLPRLLPPNSSSLSLSFHWLQVGRWLLESVIKNQHYDFPVNELLFNISHKRNDIGLLSLKFQKLKYSIGTGRFLLFSVFSLKRLHN